MPRVDLDAVQDLIAEVASAEIMPRFRNLAAADIQMKGVDDPVTVADQATEAALSRRLIERFPGGVAIGEERFAEDPSILSHFESAGDVWIIDPIDGTRNFIAGRPEFAVMVALVRAGRTIAAWIHDPNSGDTLRAERGGGVWLGDDRLGLAADDVSIPRICLAGPSLMEKLSRPAWARVAGKLPPMDATSAASFDYGRLFAGSALFAGGKAPRAAYLLFRQSKPWDHLPGLLMLDEAGGYAADFAGESYDVRNLKGGLLIAPDKTAWEAIFEILAPLVIKRQAS